MKKLILIVTSIILFGCSSNVETIDSSNFNNSWYWICTFKPGTSIEELKETVNFYSRSDYTAYYFFYPDSVDISKHQRVPIYFNQYAKEILLSPKPAYGFYKMPNDAKIYDDAVWLLEQSVK